MRSRVEEWVSDTRADHSSLQLEETGMGQRLADVNQSLRQSGFSGIVSMTAPKSQWPMQ